MSDLERSTAIRDLKKIMNKHIVDFIRVIENIGPLKSYTGGGKKMDLTLADPTGTMFFTIWREMADRFSLKLLKKFPKTVHI